VKVYLFVTVIVITFDIWPYGANVATLGWVIFVLKCLHLHGTAFILSSMKSYIYL